MALEYGLKSFRISKSLQNYQEAHNQRDVGGSADNAKECGRHGRADEISHTAVMGAEAASGGGWAKSNPDRRPIIRNRLTAP